MTLRYFSDFFFSIFFILNFFLKVWLLYYFYSYIVLLCIVGDPSMIYLFFSIFFFEFLFERLIIKLLLMFHCSIVRWHLYLLTFFIPGGRVCRYDTWIFFQIFFFDFFFNFFLKDWLLNCFYSSIVLLFNGLGGRVCRNDT